MRVVFPTYAKAYHPVGLRDPAEDLRGMISLLVLDKFENVLRHFLHGLNEFGLSRIALLHALHEARKIDVSIINGCHFACSQSLKAATRF